MTSSPQARKNTVSTATQSRPSQRYPGEFFTNSVPSRQSATILELIRGLMLVRSHIQLPRVLRVGPCPVRAAMPRRGSRVG